MVNILLLQTSCNPKIYHISIKFRSTRQLSALNICLLTIFLNLLNKLMEYIRTGKSDRNETKCIWTHLKKGKFWAEIRINPLTGTGNMDMSEFRARFCLFINFLTQILVHLIVWPIWHLEQKSPVSKRVFLILFFGFKLLEFL